MVMPFMIPLAIALTPVVVSPFMSRAIPMVLLIYTRVPAYSSDGRMVDGVQVVLGFVV